MEENFVGGIACSLFFDSSSLNVLFPNRRSKKVSRGSHISFSFQLPTLSRSNFTSCHQMSPPTSPFSLVLAFIILSIRIKILPPLLLMSKDKRSYSRGLTRRGKMATFSLYHYSQHRKIIIRQGYRINFCNVSRGTAHPCTMNNR